MRLIGALLVTALAGVPAVAKDGPAFDCAKAESSAEEAICADPRLAGLDRRLAERYAAALAMAEAVGDADTLRAMQRGWIGGRDDCWKAEDLGACIEDAYLTREGTLVASWMLDEPQAVVPWACEGNPANEVTVFYFDLERPAIRLEYGDSVDAGVLVPSASGSRYAASFGRVFWEHRGEAMFTWVEGQDMTCSPAG